MGILIGIDYGLRRVGLAVTDPMHLIATPLQTVLTGQVLAFLKDYTSKNEVEAIVIGLPLHMHGAWTSTTLVINRFTNLLKRHLPHIAIFQHDERLTSVMAQKALHQAGVSKKKRQDKAQLDVLSATFILRSFLAKYKHLKNRSNIASN